MKPLRLLIALVVLAALGGAIWYSQKHPPEPKSEFKTEKVLSVSEDKVRRVEISRLSGETLALEKGQDGKWQITAPKPYKADDSSAGSLVSTLASVNADRVVEEKNADWKTYGLDPGKLAAEITLNDGKKMKLTLGDDAPTASGVYARLEGSPRLFTVASYVKTSLDKTANDLRDKRLLPFDSEKVSRVALITKDRTLEFGRAGSNWQIVKPHPMRADSFAVDDLVRSARDATFESEVGAGPRARPFATFEAVDPGGEHRLVIAKDKDNTYYAKTTAMPGVFKVTNTFAEGLNKKLDDLRNKKLFDFGWADPQKLEVRDGEVRLVIEKKGEKWLANNKELPTDKVQPLIDALRNLSAKNYTSDEATAQARYGLNKPVAEAKVTSEDGKRVEHVHLAAGPESKYYAAREKEPSTYEIEKSAYEEIQKAVAALK